MLGMKGSGCSKDLPRALYILLLYYYFLQVYIFFNLKNQSYKIYFSQQHRSECVRPLHLCYL